MFDNFSVFRTPEGEAKFISFYDSVLASWPVQYESVFIPTSFGKTHIIINGPKDASPLVILHGAGSNSTMWIPNIADLSRNYRTYAVDIIGCPGKSIPDKPMLSGSECNEWLTDVFNGLNIQQADLIGLSLGGWLALNFALYASERLKHIVLLSPAITFVPAKIKFVLSLVIPFLVPIQPVIRKGFQIAFAKGYVPDEVLMEQLLLIVKHTRLKKAIATTIFSDDDLRKMNVPTLLLIGEQEALCDPNLALQRATRLIHHIDAEIIPDAGHTLSMEQPSVVNSRILDFLESER